MSKVIGKREEKNSFCPSCCQHQMRHFMKRWRSCWKQHLKFRIGKTKSLEEAHFVKRWSCCHFCTVTQNSKTCWWISWELVSASRKVKRRAAKSFNRWTKGLKTLKRKKWQRGLGHLTHHFCWSVYQTKTGYQGTVPIKSLLGRLKFNKIADLPGDFQLTGMQSQWV